MKKAVLILTLVATSLVGCDKNNPDPSVSDSTSPENCGCGVTISVEYDPYFSNGYAQNRYDVKARNECSNNIKEFTLVPDNGDQIPEEGAYWCNGTSW